MSVPNDHLTKIVKLIGPFHLVDVLLLKTERNWFTNDQICFFLLDSLSLEFRRIFRITSHSVFHSEKFEDFFYLAHKAQTLEHSMDGGLQRYRLNPGQPGLVESIRLSLKKEGYLPQFEEEFDELGRLFLQVLEKRPIRFRSAA